jgi:hypothetical protein
MTVCAGAAFVIANGILAVALCGLLRRVVAERHWLDCVELCVFYVPIYLLFMGYAVYLVARFGFLRRLGAHRPASREDIERIYGRKTPAVVILVPSYREEVGTIFQTLMSAALAEHPRRRVTLLIDDSPTPSHAADRERLALARQLPKTLSDNFRHAAAPFIAALQDW